MTPRTGLRQLPAALALLSAPALAQVDLSWNEGILGGAVTYSIDAPAGTPVAVLIPSLQTGPTPLSLIDPTSADVLGVGTDLLQIASFTALDPTGSASVVYPLPLVGALAGRPFYAQTFTLPGTSSLVDSVSERVGFALGIPGNSYKALGDDLLARRWASTITLDDGSVLVAGGLLPGPPQAQTGTDAVTRFDPQTQTYESWPATLPRTLGRATSVELADGRTLITGGLDAQGVLADAILFDPQTGQFTATTPMNQARVFHTLNLMSDGRVLAVGGSGAFTATHPIGHPASTTQVRATLEVFDPQTQLWSPAGQLPQATTMHAGISLGTGEVLIVGGVARTSLQTPPATVADAYLFDPGTNQLSNTQPLPQRRMHTQDGGLLNGDGLVVGGASVDFTTATTTVHNQGWRYSSQSQIWIPIPDIPGLIRCGQLICVQGELKTYYIVGMGLSGLDLTTGAATYDKNFYLLDETLTNWSLHGPSLDEHMGGSMSAIDGGLRVLLVGPGDAPGFSGSTGRTGLADFAEVLIPDRPGC